MKRLLDKFKSNSAAQEARLTHPKQLSKNDLLKLDDSFLLPSLIRGATLEVQEVNTCQFEYEHFPEWVLKGDSGRPVFFSIDEESGASVANFSIKIERDEVESLFDMDQFATIFSEDFHSRLHTKMLSDELHEWVADHYEQIGQSERGYYYRKDYRASQPPATDGSGEPFDYYCLVNTGGTHSLELEVWGNGETDVLLTVCRPLNDIRELWPAKRSTP